MTKVTKRLATGAAAVAFMACLTGVGSGSGDDVARTVSSLHDFGAPGSAAAFRDARPAVLRSLGPSVTVAPTVIPPVTATGPLPKRSALLVAGLLVLSAFALMIVAIPLALGTGVASRRDGILFRLTGVSREARAIVVAAGIVVVVLWSGS